jgi:hypothetical protein
MAETQSYPQIPTTVWWGTRLLLRKSPNATFDDAFLAINLSVQPAAARQYIAELKKVGLLNDDSKATPLAMKWRNDETYREAANEVVKTSYPQSLLDVAPPGEADRSKVMTWFMHNGLGEGTARNKAATYILMANDPAQDGSEPRAPAARAAPSEKKLIKKPEREQAKGPLEKPKRTSAEVMPLNVNVQIHISADASGEQIEKIFSSMRKYLYDDSAA